MATFAKKSSQPMSAASYQAAVRHLRRQLDKIEARCEPITARDKAALTSAIHGLSIMAQTLSRRHTRNSTQVFFA